MTARQVLLDTHALVWYADGSARLPATLRQWLDDERTTRYVGIVTFLELATLVNVGRMSLLPDPLTWFAQIRAGGFRLLAIDDQHLAQYATLPQIKDHRDPFDRLLIAQALSENLTLVSRDGKFGEYAGLKRQWA